MSSGEVAELGQSVDTLVALRPQTLTVAQLQEAVAGVLPLLDRLGGWVDIAVGELTARTGDAVPAAGDSARLVPVHAWLRDTTLCGGTAAGGQVRIAALLRQLPQVADAVLTGQISQASAAVLTRLIGPIEMGELRACQSSLIEVAAGRDPQALAGWVRELIATHCEPHLEHDERTAQDKRYLQTRNQHDGTIRGSFLLPAGDAESLLSALEPLARPTGLADGRSAGQRRADALVEICEQVLRHGTLPDAGGLRPQLAYTVPAGWAAAQAAAPLADIVHAELDGTFTKARQTCATAAWTGPQTRARIVLCDARISRVLTDRLGQLTNLESFTEEITTAQRRTLAIRDLGCITRGCTRPPACCDAHHLIHREHGGTTDLNNLVLCSANATT